MRKHVYFVVWKLAIIYWFFKRPHVAGVGVIIENNDNVLLVRHTYGDRKVWRLPSGHTKRSEEPVYAARRELKEELGLDIAPRQLGVVYATEYFRHLTKVIFTADLKNQVIIQDGVEIEEYKWWSKHKLPAELSASTNAALKLYLAK